MILAKLCVDEYMSKLPEPQWAHLDDTNISTVSVQYIINPTLFFVTNDKFLDR